jgi:hypothetical protein
VNKRVSYEVKDHRVAWIATLIVVIHTFINVGHAVAHQGLGIQMADWQNAFILIVVGLTPISAAILLWTTYARLGVLLLAFSMAGALAFGTYYHFIAISADHVAHLPDGDLQGLFRTTAVSLQISQLLGVVVAAWGFRRLRKTRVAS